MSTKLMVIGAGGRMGGRIIALALESGRFDIISAIDTSNHPNIGKKTVYTGVSGPIEITLNDTFPAAAADAVIDFSMPDAAEKTINYCLETKIPLVLGTTGINEKQKETIIAASKEIAVLYATNMSVGMNVLFALAGKVASMLGPDYDIEIIEQHHRFKKDAPSGSALTLAENICTHTGRKFPDCLVHGREGKDAKRRDGTIGIHAIRAGDITGVHSIIFGTSGETVTLNHTANNRDTFVGGALRAAEWIVGKKPALYSMADVLNIKD
ncbi:MAG: 4-hydroxy-tetrahydrodipicolinate reductase [Sedimentisphaerales bacterium]|nr:4-hydroxy-tetrahydrodipicolinate reductase [Sedimentisphaerales bacterium]